MPPQPIPVRVLVVDDDAMSRELIGLLLQRAGYLVESADSGQAALDQIRQSLSRHTPPNLVLVDLQMPGLSGTALAEQLRRIVPPATLLFAISATQPPQKVIAGFDHFLLKPFKVAQITAALATRNPSPTNHPAPTHDAVLSDKAPVLDQTVYRKIAALMPAPKLREMYALGLDDARRRIVLMRQLAIEGNAPLFVREAHAIKGSCGLLGALELRRIAARIESSGLELSAAKNVNSLDELDAASDRLQRILAARA